VRASLECRRAGCRDRLTVRREISDETLDVRVPNLVLQPLVENAIRHGLGPKAGGGTLAHELTRRGIKVVLLEAGQRQSLTSFSQVPGEAFGQLTWLDPRTQSGTWGVAKDFPGLPVWSCKTVGGTTVHWTAATPRIRPWELRARTTYGPVAGTSLIDWPIPYEELKSYYQLAERRLGVLGSKFRTRLVVGSLLLSFVPVIVMFWFSYGLMNRSIERWFSTPVEEVRQDTALMAELLPAETRATGLGLGYNIGVTLFGGMGPAIMTSLATIAFIGDLAPGYYLTLVCVLSLVSLVTIRKIGI